MLARLDWFQVNNWKVLYQLLETFSYGEQHVKWKYYVLLKGGEKSKTISPQ